MEALWRRLAAKKFVFLRGPSWSFVPLRGYLFALCVLRGLSTITQSIFNGNDPFDEFGAAAFVVGIVGQNGLAHMVGGKKTSPLAVALQKMDGNVDMLVGPGQVGHNAVEEHHGFGSASSRCKR